MELSVYMEYVKNMIIDYGREYVSKLSFVEVINWIKLEMIIL